MLSKAIRDVMLQADTQQKFIDQKMAPVASTQAQTVAMLKQFNAQWAPVVRKSGYTPWRSSCRTWPLSTPRCRAVAQSMKRPVG